MNRSIKAVIVSTVAAVTLSACGGSSYDTTHYSTSNISHCLNVVHYGSYYECHRYTTGYNYHSSPAYKPYKAPKVSKPKTSLFKKSTSSSTKSSSKSTFRSSSRSSGRR